MQDKKEGYRVEDYVPEEFRDNLPRFIIRFYESNSVPNAEKEKLWDAFFKEYLTNLDFRISHQYYKIVFVGEELRNGDIYRYFYGIMPDERIVIPGVKGYNIYVFIVDDNPEMKYLLPAF